VQGAQEMEGVRKVIVYLILVLIELKARYFTHIHGTHLGLDVRRFYDHTTHLPCYGCVYRHQVKAPINK